MRKTHQPKSRMTSVASSAVARRFTLGCVRHNNHTQGVDIRLASWYFSLMISEAEILELKSRITRDYHDDIAALDRMLAMVTRPSARRIAEPELDIPARAPSAKPPSAASQSQPNGASTRFKRIPPADGFKSVTDALRWAAGNFNHERFSVPVLTDIIREADPDWFAARHPSSFPNAMAQLVKRGAFVLVERGAGKRASTFRNRGTSSGDERPTDEKPEDTMT